MPVTTPRRPSLSIASETAQESSRFKRVMKSFISVDVLPNSNSRWCVSDPLARFPRVSPKAAGGRSHTILSPRCFSLPIHKCHGVSGAGVGAIARDVVDFVETLAFRNHRGDDRQPVLDFGCADPEITFRQSREGILVTALHRSQNSLIEFLIDYEMRQASGSYERHSLVAIPILDRTAQCMTE